MSEASRQLVQISRMDGQLKLLAFKLIGSVDPNDLEETTFLSGGTVGDGLSAPTAPRVETFGNLGAIPETGIIWLPENTSPPAGYEAWYMNLANRGTKSGDTKGRWATCWTCLEDFPISQLTKIKGHYYCTKNKCLEDFQ